MTRPLVGIFVGGRATRMGGAPKGLFATADGESIVARLARLSAEVLHDPEVVLVGRADAYSELGFESLDDDPPKVGPLGGLLALLAAAEAREAPLVLALACDMPFVTAELLARIVGTAPEAAAVAPRRGGRWEPLCARYAPEPARRAAHGVLESGRRSLQAVLDALGRDAVPLTIADPSTVKDWDEPGDMV